MAIAIPLLPGWVAATVGAVGVATEAEPNPLSLVRRLSHWLVLLEFPPTPLILIVRVSSVARALRQ